LQAWQTTHSSAMLESCKHQENDKLHHRRHNINEQSAFRLQNHEADVVNVCEREATEADIHNSIEEETLNQERQIQGRSVYHIGKTSCVLQTLYRALLYHLEVRTKSEYSRCTTELGLQILERVGIVTPLGFLRYIGSAWEIVCRSGDASQTQKQDSILQVQRMCKEGVVHVAEEEYTVRTLMYAVSQMFHLSIWICTADRKQTTY